MYQLITRKVPFFEYRIEDVREFCGDIVSGNIRPDERIIAPIQASLDEPCDANLLDLLVGVMCRCCTREPQERPKACIRKFLVKFVI